MRRHLRQLLCGLINRDHHYFLRYEGDSFFRCTRCDYTEFWPLRVTI